LPLPVGDQSASCFAGIPRFSESEQRPWFQAEYDLAARKMRLAEFRLFLNSRHSELNLRRVGAEVEKPYS
jgi:hypothetical protein